jgi:hypothetical protein
MKQNELRKAIADGIFDAVFKIAICLFCGEIVVMACQYLYGFVKGLL